MPTIQQDMAEFRRQLEKGPVRDAYRALLAYMLVLRTHFKKRYPDLAVSGLYQGYMDMTYFALLTPALKDRALKIAIVFNYDAFRFEAWLAAGNRKIQRQYWELFREGRWPGYRLVAPAKGIDAILECDLAAGIDLGDPGDLTARIETAVLAFIADIERFLSEGPPAEPAGPRS
jgi:hypothetical protein